jgi:hypothetical protein
LRSFFGLEEDKMAVLYILYFSFLQYHDVLFNYTP